MLQAQFINAFQQPQPKGPVDLDCGINNLP